LPTGYGAAPIYAHEYQSYLSILLTYGYNLDFSFSSIDGLGTWWSSTEDDFVSGAEFSIWSSEDVISGYKSGKFNLHAVRCVKD